MKRIKSGQIIYNVRTTLGVTQEELCYGLCSVSTLSKYETGERVPDSLLFYAFMQRLGKSADRVNIMISNQDAEYYEWKKDISDAIEAQKWEEVKRKKNERERVNIIINEGLENQYVAYLDALIALKDENNVSKFCECITKAITYTIPSIEEWNGESLISSNEFNLILLCLYGKKKTQLVRNEEIKGVFEKLERYVEKKIDDIFEKVKIYHRLVCTEILLLNEEMSVEERIWKEKQALKLLKSTREIYDMPEVLRLLFCDLKKRGDETARIYEKQREALVSIMEQYGASTEFRLENWYSGNERICLMNEYLATGRKQKRLTQEELSEGVCAVETYSRIESGKRAASKKNYLKLAEKLEINVGYYWGQIVTDDYSDFLLMSEQRLAIIDGKTEEAKVLLKKLEGHLDMSEVQNRQYIDFMEIIVKKAEGVLELSQGKDELKKVLQYTIPSDEKIERFYTKTEIEIIQNIVLDYLKNSKDYSGAIEVIEKVLKNDARKSVSSWYEIGVLKKKLAVIYSDIKEYEKSMQLVEECIRETIKNQDGQMLAECVNLVAWNLERWMPEKKKDYDNLYIKVFYLTDLFENKSNHKICKEYYEKKFDANKKWYQ